MQTDLECGPQAQPGTIPSPGTEHPRPPAWLAGAPAAAGERSAEALRAPRANARIDALLVAALVSAVAFCAWRVREVYPDDALIVLRYARNLLAGAGWVYNAGEAVNAATSPLHVLWVTLLGLPMDLLLAQTIAFLLPLGVAVALTYRLFLPHGRMPATIAALLVAFAPRIYDTLGMESSLLVACALGACAAATWGRITLAGILVGAAVLARPDACLLGALLLVYGFRSVPNGWRAAARLCLGAALVVTPWLVFAFWQFGSPLPNTLAVKLAQRSYFGDPPIFLKGWWLALSRVDSRVLGASPIVLQAVFVIATASLAFRARHFSAVALFCAWAWSQFLAYAAFDLPPYDWYYVPALVAGALATGALFATLFERRRLLPMLAGTGIATGLVAVSLPEVVAPLVPRPHYHEAGTWLARNTPPECSVAAGDIGVIGYLAHPRRIVDMQGLVTAGAAASIAAGDTGWWFDRHRPDYVIMHTTPWDWFERPAARRPEFLREYRKVEGTGIHGLDVWERVDRAAERGRAR